MISQTPLRGLSPIIRILGCAILAVVATSASANSNEFNAAMNLARQGNINAQYQVGNMLRGGYGINRNYTLAAEAFASAASRGHINAKFDLAMMYEDGVGIPKNAREAKRLYTEACHGGMQIACDAHNGMD